MDYIGIDVSRKESAFCILDGNGKNARETKLATDPEMIARFIAVTGGALERIGVASGCSAAWLCTGLQRYGWPVICIAARHAGFRNKNDRNEARGIADLMRVNKDRPVGVKSPEAPHQGRRLTARATLQSQLVALANTIRGLLRQNSIGLPDRRTAFEAAGRAAIGDDRLLAAARQALLETRNAVLQHRATPDRQIFRIVRADPVCRLRMTAPDVGALVSFGFEIAVDDRQRFLRSRDGAVHFSLTPREDSSGEVSDHGRISKMGDRAVGRLLDVAASRMLRRDTALWCPLKVWAMRRAQRVGIRRARVALARKRAVGRHAIWSDGQVSNGGVLRPRHPCKPRPHRPGVPRAHAVPAGNGGQLSRAGGTRWDVREATRLGREARRATPSTRMALPRSNFPDPAPITDIEARREGCHLREINGVSGRHLSRALSDIISAR